MDSNIADTRQHILDVTAAMFSENRSKLRIKDIAKTSGVGIPTLYYHFKSKSQLFAEAQAQNYMKASQQLHTHLSRAESAMEERDEPGFWTAVGENMVLAWTSGRPNDSWAIIKLERRRNSSPTWIDSSTGGSSSLILLAYSVGLIKMSTQRR
jgi:AcrR family transcriptional regulator